MFVEISTRQNSSFKLLFPSMEVQMDFSKLRCLIGFATLRFVFIQRRKGCEHKSPVPMRNDFHICLKSHRSFFKQSCKSRTWCYSGVPVYWFVPYTISNIIFSVSCQRLCGKPLGFNLMTVIQVVMTAFTAWLMEKAERHLLLMVSYICCCQGCNFLATITFYVWVTWSHS